MSQAEYLRNHVDALSRLSHDVKEPAMSGKLQEMADEFRIMVSVADVIDLAAALNKNDPPLVPVLAQTDGPLSRTLGVTRLGRLKVKGRHRILAQCGHMDSRQAFDR